MNNVFKLLVVLNHLKSNLGYGVVLRKVFCNVFEFFQPNLGYLTRREDGKLRFYLIVMKAEIAKA